MTQSHVALQKLCPVQYDYASKMLSMKPLAYWPLWEAPAVPLPAATDISANGNDAAYTGVTLGYPGIGDGRTSAHYDGANDYTNIISAGFIPLWNWSAYTVLVWMNVAAAVWIDGLNHSLMRLSNAAVTSIWDIRIDAVNNTIRYYVKHGGAAQDEVNFVTGAETVFVPVAMTVDESVGTGEMKCYYNGAQAGTTQIGIAGGAGNPSIAVIGAENLVPTWPFLGQLAHAALWDRVLTPAEIAELSVV